MKNEKLRKELENKGFTEEQINDFLATQRKIEEEEAKKLENTLSVKDAALYLDEKLDDKWNEAKVRRFINEFKEIKPMVTPGNAKKLGYKIGKEELDRFIKEYSMTKEDWKQYARQLEKQIEELKNKMESIETSDEVSNASEGLELGANEAEIEEVVEILKEEEKPKLTPSVALKFRITYGKVKRHINDERFEVEFKKNGAGFTGVLSVFRLDIKKAQLLGVESLQSSEAYSRGNENDLAVIEEIEKQLLPKIQDKLIKAINNVKEKE